MDDVATGFAAGVSALQFNEGNVQLRIGPGDAVGDKAIVTALPATGGLFADEPHRHRAARWRSDGPATAAARLVAARAARHAALRGRPFAQNVSVDNPTQYFVNALREALIADGIAVRGAAVDIDDVNDARPAPSHAGLAPIASYQSPPLSVLATTMMKLSQNQFAEALFKTIGGGTAKGGSEAVRTMMQVGASIPREPCRSTDRDCHATTTSRRTRWSRAEACRRSSICGTRIIDAERGRDGTLELRMKPPPSVELWVRRIDERGAIWSCGFAANGRRRTSSLRLPSSANSCD